MNNFLLLLTKDWGFVMQAASAFWIETIFFNPIYMLSVCGVMPIHIPFAFHWPWLWIVIKSPFSFFIVLIWLWIVKSAFSLSIDVAWLWIAIKSAFSFFSRLTLLGCGLLNQHFLLLLTWLGSELPLNQHFLFPPCHAVLGKDWNVKKKEKKKAVQKSWLLYLICPRIKLIIWWGIINLTPHQTLTSTPIPPMTLNLIPAIASGL